MESSLRARVASLATAEPALADDLAVRGTLIEIVDQANVAIGEVRLSGEIVRARLAAGVPLLNRLAVPTGQATTRLFERLAAAMLADPATRASAETTLVAVRSHRLHAEQVVGEVVVGHDEHLAALAAPVSVPAPFLAALAALTARPLLVAMAARLRPALALGVWDQGFCPICGGRPAFAERPDGGQSDADAETEARLRCGRCTTGWAWTLPRCPDCRSGRLAVLETLDAGQDGHWWLMGCDACQSYVKVSNGRRSDRLGDLLVDDLATWKLDRVALGHGLARPGSLGFPLEHGDDVAEELDDD